MMMIMKQIGTGNAREMEIFADEVRKDIERLGYNLVVEFEALMERKYGKLVRSNFGTVILKGNTIDEIETFIAKVK